MSEPLPETIRKFRLIVDAFAEAGRRYIEHVRPGIEALAKVAVELPVPRLQPSAAAADQRGREDGSDDEQAVHEHDKTPLDQE